LLPTEALREARHAERPIDLALVPGYELIRLHNGISDGLAALSLLTRIGLVTSSPLWYVDQLLNAHLPDVEFVIIVTYEDVENLKPDPEPLHLALTRTGVSADRAIYVGDADVDFEACKAAGIAFHGAGWADRRTFPTGASWVRTPQDLVELIGSRA
jgi:phosphoglycolate phosphatase-like HAD superfamily hydrolase